MSLSENQLGGQTNTFTQGKVIVEIMERNHHKQLAVDELCASLSKPGLV